MYKINILNFTQTTYYPKYAIHAMHTYIKYSLAGIWIYLKIKEFIMFLLVYPLSLFVGYKVQKEDEKIIVC